jgi:WD40 repeat protein
VFSHDGRWLAACGFGGGVHVWDTANPTAKPLCPLAGYVYAHGLAFRPDGRLFFHVLAGKWHLFDPAEGELVALASPKARYVFPSADATRAVRIAEGSPICTWGFSANDKPMPQLKVKCDASYVAAAAFSPDGSKLVTVEWKYDAAWQRGVSVTLRDAAKGEVIARLEGAAATVDRVQFTRDGEHVVASWAGTLACWSVAEPGKPRKGVNPGRKHFQSVALHPHGPALTADNDRLVRVWDVPALTTDRTIEWNIGNLYAVGVSPDGSRVAVGSHTGKVLVWDWD